MKLKEFLYRLHRPESISKEETTEMQHAVSSVPYLAELDTKGIHSKDSYADLNSQLHAIARQEYVSDLTSKDILLPVLPDPSIEPEHEEKRDNNNLINSENTPDYLSSSTLDLSSNRMSSQHKVKRELFQVEISDFVTYLNTLPPCTIPIEKYQVDTSAMETVENNFNTIQDIHRETDELIKSSLDLNQGISSESLANLWAKQGRADLAIQMYEKLAVEYPEKSATFAVKIEKLKTDNSL